MSLTKHIDEENIQMFYMNFDPWTTPENSGSTGQTTSVMLSVTATGPFSIYDSMNRIFFVRKQLTKKMIAIFLQISQQMLQNVIQMLN